MKKLYIFYYAFMVALNLIPFIPMSIKGILGLAFILISCIRISLKDALITATIWIVFGFLNYALGVNVDYKEAALTMVLGSASYYMTAYFFGSHVETLRKKNDELSREIERRKDVEKQLKEKLTLMSSLLDTIPSPIFFKDMNLKFIGCNRAYEDAMGITDDEIKGKMVFDIADKSLADMYHHKDLEILKGLSKQIYEAVARFADGNLRNIIFHKAIFMDDNEMPAGIVGVMTDITDKKEAGKLKQRIVEHKRIMDEILENDKMKTEFFSNISHELRTPLNVILGSVQLMELYISKNQYHESKEKVERNVSTMKQNCYRLLRLVNNLIDISKIDAKAFELQLKNCDIIKIIRDITLSVADYTENKGIHLLFQTDMEAKVMACDDDKIERIMLNLLSNAIKFTNKGGYVSVNVVNQENGLYIHVKDNGVGIPEDKQDLIFKRFCQVDEMFTRQNEGSGIGLSLVKSLVEMHGGTIAFESRVGIGTSFTIFLPYKMVESSEPQHNILPKQEHIERISIEFSDIYSIRS